MRSLYFVVGLVLICSLGCACLESACEDEKEIPLSEVPAAVVAAAEGAVEGISLTEADVEEEDGRTVYGLEGTADGIEYSIEVTADGKVLEVEKETEDDEDDDEGEDDEDDDEGEDDEDDDEGEDDDDKDD
ncbi:MAG: hypothetical protein JSU70_17415 [Phycisphaerales bacterium]|nr:MAG: hypothetical protein JSU70_17415 [Phycisphaerales bacterium]